MTNLNDLDVRVRSQQITTYVKVVASIRIISQQMQTVRWESGWNNLKTLQIRKSLKQWVDMHVLVKDEVQRIFDAIAEDRPMGSVTRAEEICSDFTVHGVKENLSGQLVEIVVLQIAVSRKARRSRIICGPRNQIRNVIQTRG